MLQWYGVDGNMYADVSEEVDGEIEFHGVIPLELAEKFEERHLVTWLF